MKVLITISKEFLKFWRNFYNISRNMQEAALSLHFEEKYFMILYFLVSLENRKPLKVVCVIRAINAMESEVFQLFFSDLPLLSAELL